ncbi:type I restriction endonuclease, partial [Flavobacterium sp. B17]|uniref:type I restriction endonuclease n=1 Tax=Flavobacterium sp. B17 TaxID=95618 RepID=UPI0005B2E502
LRGRQVLVLIDGIPQSTPLRNGARDIRSIDPSVIERIEVINGLPLVVIELKNATDENATVKSAFNQLQTYKQYIPSLFTFNEILIASD